MLQCDSILTRGRSHERTRPVLPRRHRTSAEMGRCWRPPGSEGHVTCSLHGQNPVVWDPRTSRETVPCNPQALRGQSVSGLPLRQRDRRPGGNQFRKCRGWDGSTQVNSGRSFPGGRPGAPRGPGSASELPAPAALLLVGAWSESCPRGEKGSVYGGPQLIHRRPASWGGGHPFRKPTNKQFCRQTAVAPGGAGTGLRRCREGLTAFVSLKSDLQLFWAELCP